MPSLLTVALHIARPQREVVPQQLHDERAIFVALLAEGIQLGDGVVEGGLGQAARPVRAVQDLVVEDGEVERQAEPDGVSGRQLGHGDVTGSLIRHQGVLGGVLAVVARCELGEVSVIITLHSGRNVH